MLRQTGEIGDAREHFHFSLVRQSEKETGHPRPTRKARARRVARRVVRKPSWEHADGFSPGEVRDYVAKLVRTHTGSSGVYSIKTHWNQYRRFILEAGLDENVFGAPVTFVWLRRQDRVAQACSQVRAQQTGLWQENGPEFGDGGEPRYDAEAITKYIGWMDSADKAWERYFSERNIEPLALSYEEWSPQPETAVDEIFGRLGMSRTNPVAVEIEKISDGVSTEWARRFRTEFPDWADRSVREGR